MTRVAILWHMHQPFYQDLATGEHVLPWVRLHALKDYWGMVALLDEFPGVKVTFNLVPSLLVQLEAFARDEARDRHLELGLKPADRLTDDERAFCVAHFFHAHRARMIDPHPRYRELFEQRGARGFSTDDLRDLQVWHKLVWIDQSYQDEHEGIRALLAKDRGFSEQDKAVLRAVELELLRKVIPAYAAAAASGRVELSTSPFYHPILPLLCDTDVYRRTHPQSRMPREPFRHPEDAAEQLARAVALHARLFGRRPDGLWPSEGSVSDAMVPLVADAGFRWMATDEEILARTAGIGFARSGDGHVDQPERLYRPYAIAAGGRTVACGFRDHTLSDLIGFTYASWSADGAADDFVYRLVGAGRAYAERTGGEAATVFVILDGENAWEHYDRQGRPFLRALYSRLASHPEIETVTMAEACAAPAQTLHTIFPGSWIGGDFYIWIGHPDDHRAWSQLAEARRTLEAAAPAAAPAAVARARDEILIAEGSDWFWWYGDDHSSDHDVEFDELFRRHVRNAYRALDRPVPEELFVTNITTGAPRGGVEPPTGLIEPAIDGEVTSYFEWIGAGCVDMRPAAGTMHQAGDGGSVIEAIEFGFDLDRRFVRVDGARPMREALEPDVEIRLKFVEPAGRQVVIRASAAAADLSAGRQSVVQARLEIRRPGGSDTVACGGLAAAAGRILEVRVPFVCLGAEPGTRLAFVVAVNRAGAEVAHHPRRGPIEIDRPDGSFPERSWTA
ncbi:MAG: glycoside hydrolase [Acidobacteria bacterium]|nr:glycoside hydrolase [Acidobacteriota bacterium]